MTNYVITSSSLSIGEKYNGVVKLANFIEPGKYRVADFVTTNRFPNITGSNQFSNEAGPAVLFSIPEGVYNGFELATAMQTAFDTNLWTVAGGTVSYDSVTNKLTITYNNTALDNAFQVRDSATARVLGLSVLTDYQDTVAGPINISQPNVIYMTIVENITHSLFDSNYLSRDLFFTSVFDGNYFTFKPGYNGYEQVLEFRSPSNKLTVMFYNDYNEPISQHPIDWHLILTKMC